LNGFQVLSRFEIWIQNTVCFCRLFADRPRSDGGPSARRAFAAPSLCSVVSVELRTVRLQTADSPRLALLVLQDELLAVLLTVCFR
jgi:hypothetical protein